MLDWVLLGHELFPRGQTRLPCCLQEVDKQPPRMRASSCHVKTLKSNPWHIDNASEETQLSILGCSLTSEAMACWCAVEWPCQTLNASSRIAAQPPSLCRVD